MEHEAKAANVLITSASAKVLLVQAFKAACDGWGGRVVTADLSDPCAAAFFADAHVRLPPSDREEAFAEALEDVCRRHRIGLIVPTRDGELPLMARLRRSFAEAGVFIHVASPETVAACLDKRRFARFCRERGFPVIDELTPEEAARRLPVFAKPLAGGAGRGARIVRTPCELEAAVAEGCLLQPVIDAPEYSVDVLMTLDGRRCLGAVVRSRRQVQGGEAVISVVEDRPELARLAERMALSLGLVGQNNLQFFLHPEAGPLAIEVNPRFGGATNLSIQAGLDSPRRILQMLLEPDRPQPTASIRHGACMYRYKQDIIVFPDEEGPDG